jgi:hypothetical protein
MPHLQEMVASIGAQVGIAEIAQIAPIVGQIIGFVSSISEAAEAQVQAEKQANIVKCHEQYAPVPQPPYGTGRSGAVVPADIFSLENITSVAQIFEVCGEVSNILHYQATGYSANYAASSPENIKLTKQITGKSFGNPTGLSSATMQQLKRLRLAMGHSQGSSYDGGVSLLPLYLDLFTAQIRLGRITKSWCRHNWMRFAWHYDNIGSCTQYERRAIDQFEGMLRSWELTANPLYGKDKLELQKMIEQSAGASRPPRLSSALAPLVHSKPLRLQATFSQHGLANLSASRAILPPELTMHNKLAHLPLAQTRPSGMSPQEHQRIIDAIVAAANGEGHPLQGREMHIDDDLDPNDPTAVLPEHPDFVARIESTDEDDYAVTDRYWADVFGDIGGDDFSQYGPYDSEYDDCGYGMHGAHIDEEEDLDPWGDQFIGVGASRVSKVQHLKPLPQIRKMPARPAVVAPIARALPKPLPMRPIAPIAQSLPRPAPPPLQTVRPISPAAQALPRPMVLPQIQKSSFLPQPKPPLKVERPLSPTLRRILPNGPVTAPVSQGGDPEQYDGGYAEFADESQEWADDAPSDDEILNAYADETEDSEDEPEEYDDASSFGYGYGDYGDEECYPHDGSTYGWDD